MKPSNLVLRTLFLTAACLLAVTILLTYSVEVYTVRADRTRLAQRAVLEHLDLLLSTLKDAETGQRGFLLTGDDRYLEPYRDSLKHLGSEQEALHRLVAAENLSADEVGRLDRLVQEKLAELQQTILLRSTNASTDAIIVKMDKGKAVMDDIRAILTSLTRVGEQEYAQDAGRAERAMLAERAAFLFTGIVNLVFLAWAFRRVAREMNWREAAVFETSRQKEMLSTTLASIGDGVIVTNTQGVVTFVNAEAERLTGWNKTEAYGQPLADIFRIIDERTRQSGENPVQQILRLGKAAALENHTLLVAKDGREIPIDDSAAPIRQRDGLLFGVVLVFRDFSGHRQNQEALAQAKAELEQRVLERTAKLNEMISELQQVSYAITHDMRAPLRAMNSFATLLMEECATGIQPAVASDYCRRIIAGATRLDKLITDALNYTNAIYLELPMQPVNLTLLIRGLLDTYPNLHPAKADIRIEGELPTVSGNESLLTQCFSNLLGNAVKFVAPGVRPEVHIRAAAVDGFAQIRIEDNGIGIPKNVQYRLFGMFEKLDNKYEGTGIGLAIVRKVVKRMDGKVSAESEPSRGSVFTVELRLA